MPHTVEPSGTAVRRLSITEYCLAAIGVALAITPLLRMVFPGYVRMLQIAFTLFGICVLPRTEILPRFSIRSGLLVAVPICYYVGCNIFNPPDLYSVHEILNNLVRACAVLIPWIVVLEIYLRRIPRRAPYYVSLLFVALLMPTFVVRNLMNISVSPLIFSTLLFLVAYITSSNNSNSKIFISYFVYGSTLDALMAIWHYGACYVSDALFRNQWPSPFIFEAALGRITFDLMGHSNVPDLFIHPQNYSCALLFSACITCGMIAIYRKSSTYKVLVVSLCIQILAIVLTQTRAAMISMVAVSLVAGIAFVRTKTRSTRSWFAVVLPPVILLAIVAYSKGNSGPCHQFYDRARVDIWKFAWSVFCKHPFFGIGYGNATQALSQYVASNPSVAYLSPYIHLHNEYLHLLVGGALLGALMFVMFMVSLIAYLRAAYGFLNQNEKVMLLAFSFGLVGIAVHCLFDIPLSIWNLPFILAAFLGYFLGSAASCKNVSSAATGEAHPAVLLTHTAAADCIDAPPSEGRVD